MLRRWIVCLLLGLSFLILPPAQGELAISARSTLDNFTYDLDHIHLRLENIDARWQISPFDNGKLLVERLRARRLIITVDDSIASSKEDGLPERIHMPFPVKIQQAEIDELVVINGNKRHTLNRVQFDFEADTKALNLRHLRAGTPWGEINAAVMMDTGKPFPIGGVISLARLDGNTPYDIHTRLSGNLKTLRFESSAALHRLQDGKVALLQTAESSIARVSVHGQLGLKDDYPLTANFSINEFHAERAGNYPVALINLDIDLHGKLLPKPAFHLQFAVRDSQWQGQDLSGSGKMSLDGGQIRNIDALVNLAANSLKVSGSLGQADSHLEWHANLPNLSVFGSGFAGRAQAHGNLDGLPDNPSLSADLFAEQLHLPGGINCGKLQGSLALAAGEHGNLTGELTAGALQYGQHLLQNARLTIQGTRARHNVNLTAAGESLQLESRLQGGLINNKYWQGWLQQLAYRGKTTLSLQEPSPLTLDRNGVMLGKAALQLSKGHILIDHLQTGSGRLVSKGRIHRLTLEDLPAFLTLPAQLQGDLQLSGMWNINARETLNGNASLWRESGDLALNTTDGTAKPLQLREIRVEAEFSHNRVNLMTRIEGQNLGNLDARIKTTLSSTDSGYALLSSSPLTMTASARLHTLAWLPLPPSLMTASLDGKLDMSVQADGTFGSPELSGSLSGNHLQFALPNEGVTLVNGKLEAAFEQDRLLIRQATLQGGEGYLNASGLLLNEDGQQRINLDWTAEKFTAIARADRLLVLSGSGKTTLAGGMLSINGDFSADKGLIELASEDTPELGDDVVVVGQSEPMQEPALKILLNRLRIDLGKEFILRGHGVDAELGGALTLTGLTGYHPHAEGRIQTRKGTYMAYGQVLNIERGILNFSGPLNNPGLDIRAMRNSRPVNAGIEITGSASLPLTRLVSDPNVPESEKLSWLVLGHGMDRAGKNDFALLSLAAGALLSQGQSVPLQTQIARAAGLDEFGIYGSDAESAVVTFGKRLTSRLYLSYEKSISGLLDVARLTFTITPRWSLRAEAGTESAVDVLYTFSFK